MCVTALIHHQAFCRRIYSQSWFQLTLDYYKSFFTCRHELLKFTHTQTSKYPAFNECALGCTGAVINCIQRDEYYTFT